jgi:hypothetical protein
LKAQFWLTMRGAADRMMRACAKIGLGPEKGVRQIKGRGANGNHTRSSELNLLELDALNALPEELVKNKTPSRMIDL